MKGIFLRFTKTGTKGYDSDDDDGDDDNVQSDTGHSWGLWGILPIDYRDLQPLPIAGPRAYHPLS